MGWGGAGRCVLLRGSGVPGFASPAHSAALLFPEPGPGSYTRAPGATDLTCLTDLVFSLSLLTQCSRSIDGPPFSQATEI